MTEGIQEESKHFIKYLNIVQSLETGKLSAAIAKAQGEFNAVAKNKVNPHFNSSYADLSEIIDSTRLALSKNGVAVNQFVTSFDKGRVSLVTRISHQGEWIASECSMPARGETAQAVGSAITYAKRYALAAILCVAADDDDDGSAATGLKRAVENPEAVSGGGVVNTSPKGKPSPANSKPKPVKPTEPAFPDINGWSRDTVNAYCIKAFGVDDYRSIPTVEEKKWLFEFVKATPYETYLKSTEGLQS